MPRDAEFARVRQYMTRRCRYAAALILNVQVGTGGGVRERGGAGVTEPHPPAYGTESACALAHIVHQCLPKP